ncbi:hypothetical protein MPSEU_000369500 [Mayamaea pseudoterrestris]|nr:hypothetical protein MPSEU_000369500 [Mayamaea pseudoterrestris]
MAASIPGLRYKIDSIVVPGDRLATVRTARSGCGTYVKAGIYASLVGRLQIRDEQLPTQDVLPSPSTDSATGTMDQGPTILVQPSKPIASLQLLAVGQVAIGRVTRITRMQAFVDILATTSVTGESILLGEIQQGTIRKEDIRAGASEQVQMQESFLPNDLILCKVLALDQQQRRSYVLATCEPELGVLYAESRTSGLQMLPSSWKEMSCFETGTKEPRKCARPRTLTLHRQRSIWAQKQENSFFTVRAEDQTLLPLLLPDECQHHSHRYDALACWLLSLVLNLPDQSFKSGFVTMDVSGMQCTAFVLEGLNSSATFGNGDFANVNHSSLFHLQINNIVAACSASYHLTGGWGGHIHAKVVPPVDATMAALDWTLAIRNSNNHSTTFARPDTIYTHQCQTGPVAVNLEFTGSTSARLIDLFRYKIARYMADEIQQQVCPLLATFIDPLMTKYIRRLNTYLEPFMHDDTADLTLFTAAEQPLKQRRRRRISTTTSINTNSTVTTLASQAPVLVEALSILNDYLTYYLRSGLLQHWFPHTHHDESQDCGWIFSGVNGFVNDLLPPGGKIAVPIPPRLRALPALTIPSYGRIEVVIQSMVLSGLDDWSHAALLQPTNNDDFTTRLSTLHNMLASFNLSANISSIGGMFQGDDLLEHFRLDVNASSLDAWLTMAIDLEPLAWQNLTIANFMGALEGIIIGEKSPQVSCILGAIAKLLATDLGIKVRLSGLTLTPSMRFHQGPLGGQFEGDLDDVLNNVLELVLRDYSLYARQALYGFTRRVAKQTLNDWLHRASTSDGSCHGPRANDKVLPRLANFSDFWPLTSLNNLLGESTTLKQLNGFIACTSNFLSRAVVETIKSSSVNDSLRINLQQFTIANTGSVRELKILAPMLDGIGLNSSIYFGAADMAIDSQPQILFSGDASYVPLGLVLSIKGRLAVSSFDCLVESVIQYDLARVQQIHVSDVLQHGQCLTLPTVSANVDRMRGQLGILTMLFDVNASMDQNGLFDSYAINFDSREYPWIAQAPASATDWIILTIWEMVKSASLHIQGTTNTQCGMSSPEWGDDGFDGVNVLGILMTILAFFILAQPTLLLIPRTSTKESLADRHVTLSASDDELLQPLLQGEPPDAVIDVPLDETRRLIDNPCVPFFAKIGVTVLIVSTTVLLVSSNLGVGATVDVYATINNQHLALPSVFAFGLINTARDMLKARIYPLFLLVVSLSGIWPYTKLIMLLYAWIAAPCTLSPRRRGRYLLALDGLGKFSLVDAYVMILFMVAFRYHATLYSNIALDVFVTPHFGFYGFLLATNLSLVVGHVLIYYHRRCELQSIPESDNKLDSLRLHEFQVDDLIRRLSAPFVSLLVACFLLVLALIAIGATTTSFVFDIGGLAGYAIEGSKRTEYSLISLGLSLRTSMQNPESLFIAALQGLYFFYTIIAPLGCLALLLILVLKPLTLKRRLFVMSLAEIANAWSAIEVFALSVFAAVMQTSTFAAFMVGDYCDFVDEILKDTLERDDATCYTVRTHVSKSAVILVVAALLNSVLVSVVLRLAHMAVDECILRSSGNRKTLLMIDRQGLNLVEWLATYFPWTVVDKE